ncbi:MULTISPECIES: hypothetical protein [unclassified Escherichia]|uniref:hypothetical protein n=1 Tax=unclassified Escherichia TaxID=2608889 RepID=UPI001028FC6A|nr:MULTISPECIES: hypothetical protein [unclassified Escherichia]RZM85668.1 hypothetical protein D9742_20085 [Escherichia sp. E1V33]TBR62397.1 hypothetical protein D9735_21080 [Escherichia sp. E1S7]TBR67461.1 hypothetical protein D9737_11145 [Escherichia sp. E10V4]TLI63163.1 hypothetical protein FEK50_23610 [Escherichia sp. E2586]
MMSKITGVLVDGHIFDIKNDMESGYCFPNSLFPGATFKMVIDNDPINNDKVKWTCSTNADNNVLAVSQDGTVTFPGVDEKCVGKIFVIFATDKSTNKSAGIYVFIVKRFFKYSIELYNSVKDILPWIENMNGNFPEARDIYSYDYDNYSGPHIINREVNAGLYQEWGTLSNSGWDASCEPKGICSIYAFDKDNNTYYCLRDYGEIECIDRFCVAQAVASYGESID